MSKPKSINQEKEACLCQDKGCFHKSAENSKYCLSCQIKGCHTLEEKGETGTPNAINIDHFPTPITPTPEPKCCTKSWTLHEDGSFCPTPKNESWEEEFAQLVVNGDISKYILFIKKVEADALASKIKEIEGLRTNCHSTSKLDCPACNANSALDDVLKIMEK